MPKLVFKNQFLSAQQTSYVICTQAMNTLNLALLILSLTTVTFAFMAFHWARKYFSAREEIAGLKAQGNGEEQMMNKIQALAAQALKGNTESFIELTKMDHEKRKLEMENILQPIRHSLDTYKKELSELESERKKSYFQVESELKKVMQVGEVLSRETSSLKNALKRPHIRGRWGEVQLRNCIELAGMSEHSDITFQDIHNDDNKKLIPDMTVRMPGGRLVVVDAKTPIDAFLSSLEAVEENEKQAELIRHGKHVRQHVNDLSTKAYNDAIKDSPDFTIMFLPNESFLYAALETQPDLMEYALNKKILIATPPTLIGLLKVIRYGWNEERLAENASKISEAGIELHKRVCDFVDAYLNVGKSLDKARAEYDKGLNRLQSRVIVQAERLEKLGAKSSKDIGLHSLPESSTASLEAPQE